MSYKSSIDEPIPKYWKVTTNEPGRFYKATRFIGVVAYDAQSAIEAVKQQHPTATIVSINHEGPVNILAT
ncbi:hypothetical protein [Methylomonas sp. MgM2]